MEDKIVCIDYKYLTGSFDIGGDVNEYTGSLPAKDGTKGIFSNFFRYRFSLKIEDKQITNVMAAWYFGCNAYDLTDPGKITVKEFEASEEGCAEAGAWIQAAYDEA